MNNKSGYYYKENQRNQELEKIRGKINLVLAIFLIIIIIFLICANREDTNSNGIDYDYNYDYDDDYYDDTSSSYVDGCPQNKTWDEMTSHERKACEEYFESKFKSGEWSFN